MIKFGPEVTEGHCNVLQVMAQGSEKLQVIFIKPWLNYTDEASWERLFFIALHSIASKVRTALLFLKK